MELIETLINYITQGGHGAIIALLFGAVVALIYDRKNLTKTIKETTDKTFDIQEKNSEDIREIVEKYHQGNLNLVQALNEIKVVLIAIQTSNR